jgi:MFS family permease
MSEEELRSPSMESQKQGLEISLSWYCDHIAETSPRYSENAATIFDDEMIASVKEEQTMTMDRPLTQQQIWNLLFCILAWACTIASLTVVVGTSNVVLLSIGGDPTLSSVPLAAFFLGASLVSLVVTPWHFKRWGRKMGFLFGVGLGLLGSGLGSWALLSSSTPLLIVATACFGAAAGIGFYLRFAAVEVVPKHWADKAVTLVVSGGCIAAFAGPESSEGTRGMFGDEENLLYLGAFMMTAIFNVCNGIFTSLVEFPDSQPDQSTPSESVPVDHRQRMHRVLTILQTRHFVIPMFVSSLSWIVMAVPMSVMRLAMFQVGFTSRQSLTAIELHFLGMYAPGFVTGQLIARYGPRLVAVGSVPVFLVSIACLQLTKEASAENPENIVLWIVGMVLIGAGWNCAYSGSTVGSTRSYASRPGCKSAIQAANDGLTLLLAGAVICSASFFYNAGGGGLQGWRVVNWVVLGFLFLLIAVLVTDLAMGRRMVTSPREVCAVDSWSAPAFKLSEQTTSAVLDDSVAD